jgi:hypothetical protein
MKSRIFFASSLLLTATLACGQFLPRLPSTPTPGELALKNFGSKNFCGVPIKVDTGRIYTNDLAYNVFNLDGSVTVHITEEGINKKIEEWRKLGLTEEQIELNRIALLYHELRLHPCQVYGYREKGIGTKVAGYRDLTILLNENSNNGDDEIPFVTEGFTDLAAYMLGISQKENVNDLNIQDIKALKLEMLKRSIIYNGFEVYTVNMLFLLKAYSEEDILKMLKLFHTSDLEERYDTTRVETIWRILLQGHDLNEKVPQNVLTALREHDRSIVDLMDQRLVKGTDAITFGDYFAIISEEMGSLGIKYTWQGHSEMSPEELAQMQSDYVNDSVKTFVDIMKKFELSLP